MEGPNTDPFCIGTFALEQRRPGPRDTPRALLPATSQPSLIVVCKVQAKTSPPSIPTVQAKALKGKIREDGSKVQSLLPELGRPTDLMTVNGKLRWGRNC